MTKHTLTLNDGDELDLFASPTKLREVLDTANRRAHRHFVNGKSQPLPPPPPPVEPPPDPEPKPGAVVFSEGFETFPGAWKAEKGLFTQGNTKTHGIPPTPAMGEHSLRMKLAIGAPDPGKFPPGGSDRISRTIKLAPGKAHRVTEWGVAHDTGEVSFEVVETGKLLGFLDGTAGLNELEWKPRGFDFVTETGDVELVISYTAPASITAESGHKIALIEIAALE